MPSSPLKSVKKQKRTHSPYVLDLSEFFKKKEMLLSSDDSAPSSTKKMFQTKRGFSAPSGSELEYNPDKWNMDSKIRNTNNCYTYALGTPLKTVDSKPQPGYASSFNHIKKYSCKDFQKRLKKDVPSSYMETFDNPCLPGFYKVFLTYGADDYHWYRQDKNNYWSHKPGSTDVTNVDASGNLITNPELANRKYESLDYNVPCFYSCIYRDLARSLDTIYKRG